jgi:DNA topoisomerase-1
MSILFIVESPGKVRTIQGYLGPGYRVMASVGHVIDLDPKTMSIDISDGGEIFSPKYSILTGKKKIVSGLRKAAREAKGGVILATDQDREGEFIAYSLAKELKLSMKKVNRVVFNSITREAITEALQHPRTIDQGMVTAQQTRRMMDRLVGYTISPFLGKGHSAGRVQSVVLRLVVEQEEKVARSLASPTKQMRLEGTFRVGKEKQTVEAAYLDGVFPCEVLCMTDAYKVKSVKESKESSSPPPCFTTSTLQQEASKRLHMKASTIMQAAQRLYEQGHITYMRTDSSTLSPEATDKVRAEILQRFGQDYMGSLPKSKARAAHECIRPTTMAVEHVNTDQSMYHLIWSRTVASLMADSVTGVTTVIIANGKHHFRAAYRKILFEGWKKVYHDECLNTIIDAPPPLLRVGQDSELLSVTSSEHTEPLESRFTEGTLVREMEHEGIGRPSTYAGIIDTLLKRGYIEVTDHPGASMMLQKIVVTRKGDKAIVKETQKKTTVGGDKKRISPTDRGKEVTTRLIARYPEIMEVGFTAKMEQGLDHIVAGDGGDNVLAAAYKKLKNS